VLAGSHVELCVSIGVVVAVRLVADTLMVSSPPFSRAKLIVLCEKGRTWMNTEG
jgi:hypothetical protein